jgi:hypothetical protein
MLLSWVRPDAPYARSFESVFDPEIASFFEQWGFAHVRAVLSADEIARLRQSAAEFVRKHGARTGDLLSYPEMRWVLLDERIVTLARRVLGPHVVYFGESSFVTEHRRVRIVHHDARGDTGDPTRTTYPLVRIGIYLQDHAEHSDGLKLRPGSHRLALRTPGNFLRVVGIGRGQRYRIAAFRGAPYYNVPSRPGDLVIWNLRIHHVGHAVRLRFAKQIALAPWLENYVPEFVQAPKEKSRSAVFMTFGAPSEALESYIAERARTPFLAEFWKHCHFDNDEARRACREAGVVLRTDCLRGRGFSNALTAVDAR